MTSNEGHRRFVLGLDLGPPGEPTGFAILERPEAGTPAPEPDFHVRHLERFPPGATWSVIVEAVAARAGTAALRGSPLVADGTAVGKALIDLLRRAKVAVVPVMITAGQAVQRAEGGDWLVPKKELVTSLQLALQGRRLKVAPGLPEADLLVAELSAFRLRRVTLGDAEATEWRVGRHDDLVFAVALACWHAGRYRPLRAGSIRHGPLLIHSAACRGLNF
jgi:hypothetical protein